MSNSVNVKSYRRGVGHLPIPSGVNVAEALVQPLLCPQGSIPFLSFSQYLSDRVNSQKGEKDFILLKIMLTKILVPR